MSLRLNEKLFAFAGDTLAVAHDAEVRLFREREEFASFRAETRVEHLKVSPDGRALLLYGASAGRVWSWNDREGLRLLASARQSRDAFGCGFLDIGGHLLLLVAQHGVLRGISSDGEQAFTANMRSPHSFLPRIFVPLPGGRLALLGSMFGDPQDTIVTVAIDALVQGGDCVQRAIGEGLPFPIAQSTSRWDLVPRITPWFFGIPKRRKIQGTTRSPRNWETSLVSAGFTFAI